MMLSWSQWPVETLRSVQESWDSAIAKMMNTDPATGKTLFQSQFEVNLKLIILIIPHFILQVLSHS